MPVVLEGPKGAEKCFLRRVLGEHAVAGDAPRRSERCGRSQPHELRKGRLVSRERPQNQGASIRGVGDDRPGQGEGRACQGLLLRNASKDWTALSARCPILPWKLWILLFCSAVRIGSTSPRILAKRSAPLAWVWPTCWAAART